MSLGDRCTIHDVQKTKKEDNVIFKWGTKRGVGRNQISQFYESFTYYGVEYFLYDCVHFYNIDEPESYIGKLVKIYETSTHEKKVKVVWFFRPIEVRNFLGDYEPKWNELFLASGEGKGLYNVNPLEAIGRKCNVVCVSNDKRNPQPSKQELTMADYIFCCTFNVQSCRISKGFPDQIDGIGVEYFFNKWKARKVTNNQVPNPSLRQLTVKLEELKKVNVQAVKDGKSGGSSPVMKESKVAVTIVGSKGHSKLRSQTDFDNVGSELRPFKKRKLLQDGGIKTCTDHVEVSRRPDHDQRINWFKPIPWEEKLKRAHETGALVLLQGLDPSFTSSQVENLIGCAFNEKVEAKIQHSTFFGAHHGKALVVFKSKDAARSVIFKLQEGCLMLGDGRVVVGSRGTLKEQLSKPAIFLGHLTINKLKARMNSEDMRKAVSTSHCAQTNTIEYDMAMEWRVLQEKSELWWKELYKRQAKEIENVRKQLKMK